MKLRSLILIGLIIIVPLVALIWATMRVAENEQLVVEQKFRELLQDRLHDVNGNVATFFFDVERDLQRITAIDDYDIAKLRDINRNEPRLFQLFVIKSDGQLTYPDPTESQTPLNATERRFLTEAAKMFTGQDLQEFIQRSETHQSEQGPDERAYLQNQSSGWFVWYWERGVNLIYWQRRSSGHIVGCALERARWMADLIAALPDTVDGNDSKAREFETRVRMVDASGKSVYQWGSFEPTENSQPFCEVPIVAPLTSWRLQCFVAKEQLTVGTGASQWLSLLAVLIAVASLLAVCGFFFVREYARDMREAAQQVSFVNQVSHELRTPLTNIRLYAELLDRDLDQIDTGSAEKPRERLSVILSEGQRLSRLIGNVLTFARQKRKTLQVQPRDESPHKLILSIVDRFRPAFERLGVEIEVIGDNESTLCIDADVVEQIVGNLLSNVEKYASSGKRLTIENAIDGQLITIDVRDAGPGIEASKRRLVFKPFARISNEVSQVAGTGIGLPIARELARLHGGDLVLMECKKGCWFRATIRSVDKSVGKSVGKGAAS